MNKCLNVLVTSLAELDRRSTIEAVTILYPDRNMVTPDLRPQRVELEAGFAARTIGVALSSSDVERHLRQMGHAVERRGEGSFSVDVPAYRNDIMHPVDLVEDVAIAYGYHNIEPCLVPTMTVGQEQNLERQAEVARRALTGLGYQETMTLILTSPEVNYDALRLPRGDRGWIERAKPAARSCSNPSNPPNSSNSTRPSNHPPETLALS